MIIQAGLTNSGNLKIVVGSKMDEVEPLEKEFNVKGQASKTVRGYLRLTK